MKSALRSKASLLVTSLALILASQSQAADNFCGVVPMSTDFQQATDLIYNNQPLTPDQVTALLKGPNGSSVVSQLDPATDNAYLTDLSKIGGALNPANYTLGVNPTAKATYIADVLSLVGQYRVEVSIDNGQGVQTYNVVLSKNIHNYLLRKALLEKLGYNVTPVQYMRKLSLQFAGTFDKNAFIESLKNNLLTVHPERWVTNLNQASTTVLNLEDVVLVPSNFSMFDLADVIPDSIPQSRRLLNSLVVPYSLTNVPESVNSFPWVAGEIYNQQLVLPCPSEDGFNAAFSDVQWIARRLAKLNRGDFQDIVSAAQYPREVAELMVEKLISRTNSLMQLTQLSGSVSKNSTMVPKTKISDPHSNLLQNGQLSENYNWPGYGPQFSGKYPDDPISGAEVAHFLQSRAYSSALQSAISVLDQKMSSNINQIIEKHEMNLVTDQIYNFFQTGQMQTLHQGLYTFPIHTGNAILSRDIVVGSYMGSDNMIQLADNIGFSFEYGRAGIIDGAPLPIVPKASLMVSRVYTHLHPLKTIKAGLKMPYKNLLIPLLEHNFASILDPVLALPVKDDLSDDQVKVLQKALDDLDSAMADGESLIVTDSLGGDIGVTAQYGLTPALSAAATILDSQTVIRRIQILKQPNHQLQIYYDPGTMNELSFGVALNAKNIPIVTLSLNHIQGKVSTHFYNLDLSLDSKKYGQVIRNMAAFRQALLDNSAGAAQSVQKPYVFDHQVSQTAANLGILFYQDAYLKTADHITATGQEGFKQDIYYQNTGTRSGKDYQSLVLSALTEFVSEETNSSNVRLDATTSGNPADTLYGKAVSRNVGVIAERDPKSKKSAVDNVFIDITHLHRGWDIKKPAFLKILTEFNTTYGVTLMPPGWLNDTDKIELYALGLDFKVYSGGIAYLAKMSPAQFSDYLNKNGEIVAARPSKNDQIYLTDPRTQVIQTTTKIFQNFVQAYKSSDAQGTANYGSKLFDRIETMLPGKKLINLLGGPTNVFIQARVNGFRTKDENGDSPLNSNTIGLIGSDQSEGPLEYIRQNLNMSGGEFFIYWFIKQL